MKTIDYYLANIDKNIWISRIRLSLIIFLLKEQKLIKKSGIKIKSLHQVVIPAEAGIQSKITSFA